GRRYLACFYGDNYPIPRPNQLYQSLWDDENVELHILSLLSYVAALRAGALGNDVAVTRSLSGSDMAKDLAAAGFYTEITLPGPEGPRDLGLVRAIRPDITFLHGLMGDEEGNVVVSQPSCEGFWAANGAKIGAIVTVEKIVPAGTLDRFRDAMPIARHKVLAVCEEPGGCHPQPLFADSRFDVPGYRDEFDHYRLWRRMAVDDELFARFSRTVLDAEDGRAGYAAFVEDVAQGDY